MSGNPSPACSPQANPVPVGVSSTLWMTPSDTPPTRLASFAAPSPSVQLSSVYNFQHSSPEGMDVTSSFTNQSAPVGHQAILENQWVAQAALQLNMFPNPFASVLGLTGLLPPLAPVTTNELALRCLLINHQLQQARQNAEQAERARQEAEEAERARQEAEQAERARQEAEQAERARQEAVQFAARSLARMQTWSPFSMTGQPVELSLQTLYPTDLPGPSSTTSNHTEHKNPLILPGHIGHLHNWAYTVENGDHVQPASSIRINNHSMEAYKLPQEPKKRDPKVKALKTDINLSLINSLNLTEFFGKTSEERSSMVFVFLETQSLFHSAAAEMIGIKQKRLSDYVRNKSYANAGEIEMWYIFCITYPSQAGMTKDHTGTYMFPAAYRTKNRRGTKKTADEHKQNLKMVLGFHVVQQGNSNSAEIHQLDTTFKNMNVQCAFGQYAQH